MTASNHEHLCPNSERNRKDFVPLMTLSSKQELLCWLIGVVAVIELFDNSHTFNVVAATYYYGFALLSIVVLLFWLRFRKR